MKKLTLMSTETMTLDKAFDDFISFKRINNLSGETIKYYQNCFKSLSEFYDTTFPCETITESTVYKYIEYLQAKNIVDISINSYLRGIRTFLYFCMDRGYVGRFSIRLIKSDKEVKETYTNEEVEILLKKPNIKKCSFSEYRNWVIINYLIGTGNRLSTVTNLLCGDIDFDNDVIKLTKTKNRRQQLVPLSVTLKGILKEYLIYRKRSSG